MKRKIIFLISALIIAVMTSCNSTVSSDIGAGREISTAAADTVADATDDTAIDAATDAATDAQTVESMPDTEKVGSQNTQPSDTELAVLSGNGNYRPKVFMYHLIRDETYGVYEGLFVRPSEFDQQLSILDELGYEYLFANEWRMTDKPSAIITLDDGYSDNYTDMLPILKKHGAKATVFVVTDLIGDDNYMTREQVRAMADSGCVSIQSHTVHHYGLGGMDSESIRAEFKESIEILESITGQKVSSLAYPGGSFDDNVISVARDFFDYAYTTKSPSTVTEYDFLTIPRYTVSRGCTKATFRSFASY